jgi:hypothetical protein
MCLLGSPSNLRFVVPWLRSLRQSHVTGPLENHLPYIPFALADELDRTLPSNAHAFEYGSGGSTLWLAKRVARLTSVEHHAGWHARVEDELKQARLGNCKVELCEPSPLSTDSTDGPYRSPVVEGNFERYVRAITACSDESLDLVLIDGRCRAECAVGAMTKVRPGGLLILDDSDRDRYAPAHDRLKAWHRREFWGIKPFTLQPAHTTVWTRPQTATPVAASSQSAAHVRP